MAQSQQIVSGGVAQLVALATSQDREWGKGKGTTSFLVDS